MQYLQILGGVCPIRQGGVAMAFSTMGEREAAGEEAGGSVLIPSTIFVVTQQGKSTAGELNPNLMTASGVQPDTDGGGLRVC